MNPKHLILENLGTFQWLLTWLICVGMVVAGYYLVPIALENLEPIQQLDAELRAANRGHINGLAFYLPFAPLTLLIMAGSGLIALIWQFRVAKKES